MNALFLRILPHAVLVLTLTIGGLAARRALAGATEQRASGVVSSLSSDFLPTTLNFVGEDGGHSVTLNESTVFELNQDDLEPREDEAEEEAAFRTSPFLVNERFVTVTWNPSTGLASQVNVESMFEANGRITSVSSSGFPARLEISVPFRGTLSFRLNERKLITLNSEFLEDLRELRGKLARIEYDPDSGEYRSIEAYTGNFVREGVIEEVGEESLSVRSGSRVTEFFVYFFAEINRNFENATMADLRPGDRVSVEYQNDETTLTAYTITAVSSNSSTVSTRVDEYSLDSHILTLGSGANGVGAAGQDRPRQVKLNAGTRITVNGRAGGIGRLVPGSRVKVTYTRQNGVWVARRLELHRRGHRGH